MLNSEAVVRAMEVQWCKKYSLSITPHLKATWKTILQTFDSVIGDETNKPWQVIHAPTGIGKTTLVIHYCAMLNIENHPGVLIVCRTTNQCDEVMGAINEMLGSKVAVASHSRSSSTRMEARAAPVLVVTHQAYRLAIQSKDVSLTYFTKWEQMYEFRGGSRKLTIIDESLDIFDDVTLPCRDLGLLSATLERALTTEMSDALQILNRVTNGLDKDGCLLNWDPNLGFVDPDIGKLREACLTPLREAIHEVSVKCFMRAGFGHGNGIDERQNCLDQLDAIEKLVQLGSRGSGVEKQRKLVATDVLLAHSGTRIVILDATARLNPIYKLLKDHVSMIDLPSDARTYDGCVLHVSKGHAVGKGSITENGEKILESLLPELESKLAAMRRVLLITCKAITGVARRFKTPWREFTVAHWGALDGRNDWADYDAIVVCGLPYLDQAVIHARLQKLSGNAASDDKHGYQTGWLSSCLVQAINRTRCRRVTKPDGGCESVDVFLMLPDGDLADTLQSSILASMPGMEVVDWAFKAGKRKAKRSGIADAVLVYLNNAPADRYPIELVRENIGASERGFRNVLKKLTDKSSELYSRVKELGVSLEKGVGRGNKSYFIKHSKMENHAV